MKTENIKSQIQYINKNYSSISTILKQQWQENVVSF